MQRLAELESELTARVGVEYEKLKKEVIPSGLSDAIDDEDVRGIVKAAGANGMDCSTVVMIAAEEESERTSSLMKRMKGMLAGESGQAALKTKASLTAQLGHIRGALWQLEAAKLNYDIAKDEGDVAKALSHFAQIRAYEERVADLVSSAKQTAQLTVHMLAKARQLNEADNLSEFLPSALRNALDDCVREEEPDDSEEESDQTEDQDDQSDREDCGEGEK